MVQSAFDQQWYSEYFREDPWSNIASPEDLPILLTQNRYKYIFYSQFCGYLCPGNTRASAAMVLTCFSWKNPGLPTIVWKNRSLIGGTLSQYTSVTFSSPGSVINGWIPSYYDLNWYYVEDLAGCKWILYCLLKHASYTIRVSPLVHDTDVSETSLSNLSRIILDPF